MSNSKNLSSSPIKNYPQSILQSVSRVSSPKDKIKSAIQSGGSFSTQDCTKDHKSPFCQTCNFNDALHTARVPDPVGVRNTRLAKKAFIAAGGLFKNLANERIGPVDDVEERNPPTQLLRKIAPGTGVLADSASVCNHYVEGFTNR